MPSTPADLAARLPLPPALAARLPSPKPTVAVVRLEGVIMASSSPFARGVINLAAVEPALKEAFEHQRLQAVALVINSPGGSPTQSALVGDRIRGLAAEHDVPVIAFCEDVAASGGYWLACAADDVVAHPTSLVGSIGVVSGGFGLGGLIERLGVERRLHTAGESKARLDPFLPEKAEDVAWLRGMQDELHAMFIAWVTERRGTKLDASAGTELFTGEVWTGAGALGLGLVDALGTLRGTIAERYPDAEIVEVQARRSLLSRLGIGPRSSFGGPDAAGFAIEAAERRAAWARFGL